MDKGKPKGGKWSFDEDNRKNYHHQLKYLYDEANETKHTKN